MENNNKSIASRWFNTVNPPKEQQPQQAVQPQVEQPKAEQENNPVRHQYRQTVLNGLKGESYV